MLHYSAEDGRKRLAKRLRAYLANFTDEEQATVRKNLRVIDASDLSVLYGGEDSDGKGFTKQLKATTDFRNLQLMVAEFDAEAIVVDGASDTFGGNEVSRSQTTAFVKLLKRVHPTKKRAVLLLVHIDRSSARGNVTDDDGYSGNSAWHNACRRRLYLQKKVEKDRGEIVSETIFLRVMKNQDGEPAPDIELHKDGNGFWHAAVTLGPSLLNPGGPAEDPAKVILRLIGEYYQRAQYVGTSLAPNSTKGVWAVLNGDPQFPRKLTKPKTAAIIRNLERDGLLKKGSCKNVAQRKDEDCWEVVPERGVYGPWRECRNMRPAFAQSAQSVSWRTLRTAHASAQCRWGYIGVTLRTSLCANTPPEFYYLREYPSPRQHADTSSNAAVVATLFCRVPRGSQPGTSSLQIAGRMQGHCIWPANNNAPSSCPRPARRLVESRAHGKAVLMGVCLDQINVVP